MCTKTALFQLNDTKGNIKVPRDRHPFFSKNTFSQKFEKFPQSKPWTYENQKTHFDLTAIFFVSDTVGLIALQKGSQRNDSKKGVKYIG